MEGPPIKFDHIMDALLDGEAEKNADHGKLVPRARCIRDLHDPDDSGGLMLG